MAQWSATFDTIMEALDTETTSRDLIHGMLHAFAKSWETEANCLIWITSVPGGNIFGSTVVFVNNEVLTKLEWTFAEWESGIAPQGVFLENESKRIKLHLDAKSSLPVRAGVRRKSTTTGQEWKDYIFHFHHDLPHNLRLTVAVLP